MNRLNEYKVQGYDYSIKKEGNYFKGMVSYKEKEITFSNTSQEELIDEMVSYLDTVFFGAEALNVASISAYVLLSVGVLGIFVTLAWSVVTFILWCFK